MLEPSYWSRAQRIYDQTGVLGLCPIRTIEALLDTVFKKKHMFRFTHAFHFFRNPILAGQLS